MVEEDLKTKIAWLYFMEGMTQDEVAQKLGMTRARVLRILGSARNDGTVQIKVSTRFSQSIELENELEKAFDLERAIVVPEPDEPSKVTEIIGKTLGIYLTETLSNNMTIGLGWGNTLTYALNTIESLDHKDSNIISLLGALNKVTNVNPSEFAWRVADRLSASCYMMSVPVFAPDAETRKALFQHNGISEVYERAHDLDLAVLSVGDLDVDSAYSKYDLLTPAELSSLKRAGAVGDILCHFVNNDGETIDHPVNKRTFSVGFETISKSKRIVLASGGQNKKNVMKAAMRRVNPNVVITDVLVAKHLLGR